MHIKGFEKNSKKVYEYDLLISSSCLENNFSLVTYNTKHFKHIKQLKILSSI
jgi:predicted nucleic acid-binding protein